MTSRPLRVHPALLAFPVVLWLVATFFYFGDIGLWNDDWFYVQRVPETGAIRALVLDRPVHIWRPLYRVITPALETLLSDHTSVLHFLGALSHGVTAGLLFLLLRRLGIGRLAGASGALVFLVCPWDTEVVFWCCNAATSLAASVVLVGLLYATRPSATAARVGLVGFACTFIACCLNEQPALLALATPFGFLGVRPFVQSEATRLLRQSVLVALTPVAAIMLYTVLARRVVGPMDIGAGHGLLPPSAWVHSVHLLLAWLADTAGSASWMRQAWRHGLIAVGEHPWRARVLLAALLTSGGWWIAFASTKETSAEPAGASRPNQVWCLTIGVVMVCAPLAPIIAFAYWLNPRVLYPSALGVGVLIAVLLSALENPKARAHRHLRKRLIATAVVLLSMGTAFAMVGIQHAYRRRALLDRDALLALRSLVPNPAPESVFVPVHLEPPPWPHGARFEGYFWSLFNSWWSAEPALRLAYGRSDLRSSHAQWGDAAWKHPSVDSVFVEDLGRAPWNRVVPFRIDSDNSVHLIGAIRFVNRAGVERSVSVPRIAELARSRGLPVADWQFPPRPSAGDAPPSPPDPR